MLPVWATSTHTRQLAKEAELVQHCRIHKKPKTLPLRFLSQQKHMTGLPMISSDLFTYDSKGMPPALDQHPLPPSPVKTPVSAIQLTPKIRSHVPKSSRPLVTATTASRPMMRNFASCVPLQMRVGDPVRLDRRPLRCDCASIGQSVHAEPAFQAAPRNRGAGRSRRR